MVKITDLMAKTETDDTIGNTGIVKPPAVQTYRSMKSDLVDVARDENTSLTSMVLAAEARKRERYQQEAAGSMGNQSTPPVRIIAVGLAAVTGLAILSLASFSIYNWLTTEPPEPVLSTPSLIFADQQVGVDFDPSASRSLFYSTIQDASKFIEPNREEVIHVYFRVSDEGSDKLTIPVATCPDLVRYAAPQAPSLLLNSLDSSKCMFGWYSEDGEELEPFFIAHIRSAESTLGYMLRWENGLLRDLRNWFNLPLIRERDSYIDTRIGSVDMRNLYAEDGAQLLYWGIMNEELLIITTSYASVSELIERLTASEPEI